MRRTDAQAFKNMVFLTLSVPTALMASADVG